MDQQKLSFPILKAAHWSVPIKSEDAADEQTATFANWILWVRVRSLPSDLPLDPNARNPVLEGRIPEAIEATLRERPVEFVRLNSGLTIVARACNVRDYQATLILQSFSEKEEQEDGRRGDGLLNGGHTYAIIQQVLKDTPADAIPAGMPDPGEAVVRVEVQTGLREEDLADISRARNTSIPVPEFAIQNLARKWSGIEAQLTPDMRKRVAFKGGDPRATDNALDLDVGDLVKLLALFNNRLYPAGKKEPVAAYTSEKALIQRWKPQDYDHLVPRLRDFIRLHDAVVLEYASKFSSTRGRKADGVRVAREGQRFTLLIGVQTELLVPAPFVFPVLAALRVFLDESGWLVPVDQLISDPEYVPFLCGDAYEQYRKEGRSNAAYFGRNRQVWQNLCLKMLLKKVATKSA